MENTAKFGKIIEVKQSLYACAKRKQLQQDVEDQRGTPGCVQSSLFELRGVGILEFF